ncbi:MAG: very-short-patch-repair endonuclease [Candidatus Aldehydirespiratoraceae bacterium]
MRNKDFDAGIRLLAAAQHGVVARRQLRKLGMSGGSIQRRVDAGILDVLSSRVVRLAGSPDTARACVMAGMLEAGDEAVVSHGTAASLWQVPGFDLSPVEVMAPRRQAKGGTYELAVVHQPRLLLEHHWIEADGLRLTTPSRLLFDLAGLPWVHPKRLERALDRLWAQRRVTHRSLTRVLNELAQRGRPGIVVMRSLIKARGALYRPPESGAEGRFRALAASWGFRSFEQQADIGDEDRWIGRVDFVDLGAGIVVEVDPAPFHSSLLDMEHDRKRRQALELAGLTVISVSERDLFYRPRGLRRKLIRAYSRSVAA